jgi:hypothetical protein
MDSNTYRELFKPDMKQALTYIDAVTGYRERAVLTSDIQTSATGNEFIRVTRHHKQGVSLSDIESIADLNIPW